MEKIVEKLIALGVPGLVLLVAVSLNGYTGGVAIVVALALLGGPFGMKGGLALLAILTLTSNAIGKYGVEAIFREVVKGLQKKGFTKNQIQQKIESYRITQGLKNRLFLYLDRL